MTSLHNHHILVEAGWHFHFFLLPLYVCVSSNLGRRIFQASKWKEGTVTLLIIPMKIGAGVAAAAAAELLLRVA